MTRQLRGELVAKAPSPTCRPSAELPRDETIEYGSWLWDYSTEAALRVWSVGFDVCDICAPYAALAQSMVGTRVAWFEKLSAG